MKNRVLIKVSSDTKLASSNSYFHISNFISPSNYAISKTEPKEISWKLSFHGDTLTRIFWPRFQRVWKILGKILRSNKKRWYFLYTVLRFGLRRKTTKEKMFEDKKRQRCSLYGNDYDGNEEGGTHTKESKTVSSRSWNELFFAQGKNRSKRRNCVRGKWCLQRDIQTHANGVHQADKQSLFLIYKCCFNDVEGVLLLLCGKTRRTGWTGWLDVLGLGRTAKVHARNITLPHS